MRDNGYVVEKNMGGMQNIHLIEPEINHQASEYFVEHYEEILRKASKMDGVDPSKVQDLVHDVMVSILNSENAGEGYSMEYSDAGSLITVPEFVYGRLKLYSKNRRYSSIGCDRHTSTKRHNGTAVTHVDMDIVFASTTDATDTDNMDSMQRAYANAHSYDSEIDMIEDSMALRSDIEFCLDFEDKCGLSFMAMFKNIDKFADKFDSSIFDRLRYTMNRNEELSTALMNVLSTAAKHRGMFDTIVADVERDLSFAS